MKLQSHEMNVYNFMRKQLAVIISKKIFRCVSLKEAQFINIQDTEVLILKSND